MSNSTSQTKLRALSSFRWQVYQFFGSHKDAFFELIDAAIQTPTARSLVASPVRPV
jgi:hypothetical protein